MAAKKNPEDYWKNIINSLKGPFPEVGSSPPMAEAINSDNTIDPNLLGNLSKITLEVYFFLNPETNKYITMQNQTMLDYGEVTLGDAAEMVKKRKRK